MKVLVVGGGGREHALAWKIIQSEQVSRVYVAPGNAGTARETGVCNVDIAADDIGALADFAEAESITLTVVGPEIPLVAGIRDYFDRRELLCFGPHAAAAQLEGSKSFSKDFLARHNIPTADYAVFDNLIAAKDYITARGVPIVIKADGLAAGKGVVVATELAQAYATVEDMLSGESFGDSGTKVVIEEFLVGEEASFICLCDGENAIALASSQDHKARDEGDLGPNTGGMGAYSPAPVVDSKVHDLVMESIIKPTMRGMASDGHPYQGFLYAGLMINPAGEVKVIEFNCRFGDPEAQPVLMRLQSDLFSLLCDALSGGLENQNLAWDSRTALGVVLAAGGYPEVYRTGDKISGIDRAGSEKVKVFHAGTRFQDEFVVTDGGRVLCVVGLGEDPLEAQANAYEGCRKISWKELYCRRDIGYRAIGRQ